MPLSLSESSPPLVTVLVNCYNSSAFLKEALDSIFAQTFTDFEVLFIDNWSTDSSAQIAQSYDARLRYLKTPEFMSLYSARSFALPHARGKYLAILDSDDMWEKNKLAHQIQIIQNKKADFIYGGFSFKFENSSARQWLKSWIPRLSNLMKRGLKPSRYRRLDDLVRSYDINLQTVLFDREKAKGLNFDPHLSLLGDLDFFFRLIIEKNFLFYYDSKKVATYRIHPSQLSHQSLKRWVVEARYCYAFCYKNKFSEENRKMFKEFILFFKSNYVWSLRKYDLAVEMKKALRLKNPARYWDWLKHRIISFFLKSSPRR